MGRYAVSGTAKVLFCPAITSLAAPTRAELTAGLALNTPGTAVAAGLVEMTNFESRSTFIDVPDAATDFTSKIPGRKEAGNPSMAFYDDDASATIRTALAEDTDGFIVVMHYGDVATKRAEVYPVTIGALNDTNPNSSSDAAKFVVDVAITAPPNKNAVIPAP